MRTFRLYRTQSLPISLEKAWAFFSSPNNLSKITPPEMGFEILSNNEKSGIRDGQIIEYKVRPLLNIPVKWVTEITRVNTNVSFVDNQISGPYKLWEHTHTFRKSDKGVEMTDEIIYALPFSWLGWIAHKLFVRKKLNGIFDYREKVLKKLFS